MVSMNPISWLIYKGRAERTISDIIEFEPWRYRGMIRKVKRGYPTPQSEEDAIFWKTFSECCGVPLPEGYGYRRVAGCNS